MITKGIIKSIDFTTNTCVVRMPLFENAGNTTEMVAEATFAIQPGIYNGYREGDVVELAFDNNELDSPVVIGKLFLGTAEENKDQRGTINCQDLTVTKTATLPLDTKLSYGSEDKSIAQVQGGYSSFKTLGNVIEAIQETNKQITAQEIKNGDFILKEQDARMTGLGWQVDENAWRIQAYDSTHTLYPILDLFRVDRSGVTIAGELKLVGYPKETVVRYARVLADNYEPDSEGHYNPTWVKENNGELIALPPAYGTKEEIDANWTYSEKPAHNDDYYIFQLTYNVTYVYNKDNDQLDETYMSQIWELVDWPEEETTGNAQPGTITRNPNHRPGGTSAASRALAIARGKSTCFYSDKEPYKNDILPDEDLYVYQPELSIGDTWFNTSYKADSIPTKLTDYIGKWIMTAPAPFGGFPTYAQVTPDNISTLSINPGVTQAYTHGELYQCKAINNDGKATWEPIGSELVANKITTNYINALDIVAKKIEIFDANNNTLFKADGLADVHEVKIANFTVANNKIYSDNKSSLDSNVDGVYIGNDGIALGKGNFVVTKNGQVTIKGYVKSVLKKYRKIEYDNEAEASAHYADWNNWESAAWGSSVPPREDEKYIWEWTQEEQGDGTLVDKGKVCVTGTAGDSAHTLKISNPFVGAPYSSDGTTSEWNTTTFRSKTLHKLTAYYGNSQITDTIAIRTTSQGPTNTGYSIVYSGNSVTITSGKPSYNSTDKLVESSIDSLSADNGSIEYILYYNAAVVAYATFEVVKNKAGENAVSYWIVASPDTVTATVNESGTITAKSPTSVSVEFDKQIGTDAAAKIVAADNLYYTTKYDNGNESSKTKISTNPISINTSSFDSRAIITIYSNNTTSAVKCASNTIQVIKDGKPGGKGADGNSVIENKTYYSLSNTSSSTGPATGDSNIVATPTVDKWSTAPQAFNKDVHTGYQYWTVERIVYSDAPTVGVWGTPVLASMLSVDFINSLAIQAKKLLVTDSSSNTLLDAGWTNDHEVTIGGFKVAKTTLSAGTQGSNSSIYMSTEMPASSDTPTTLFSIGSAFKIDSSGSAKLNGTLDAYAGNIGEFSIHGGTLANSNVKLGWSGIQMTNGGKLSISNSNDSNTFTMGLTRKEQPALLSEGDFYLTSNKYDTGFMISPTGSAGSSTIECTVKVTGTAWGGGSSNKVKITANKPFLKTKTFTISYTGYDFGTVTRTTYLTIYANATEGEVSFGGLWYLTSATVSGYTSAINRDGTATFNLTQSFETGATCYALGSIIPKPYPRRTLHVFKSGEGEIHITPPDYASPTYGTDCHMRVGRYGEEFDGYSWGDSSTWGTNSMYITKLDWFGDTSWVGATVWLADKGSGWGSEWGNVSAVTEANTVTYLGTSSNRWTYIYGTNINWTNAYGTNAATISDRRVKTNIDYDISKYDILFDNLKPVKYKYKDGDSNRTHLGLIAQDVEQSMLENGISRKDFAGLIIRDDTGLGFDSKTDTIKDEDKIEYGIRYGELHALEIRQIQMLKQEIAELKAALAELQNKNV